MTALTCQSVTSLPTTKIHARHLDRVAVVYVRQSSLQQVVNHQESTKRQYELVDVAMRMGWPRARVQVIDEDLGISGASAEGRAGFQRLLAEIALDHIGIVLGIEMSRLARSCRDWYQLLELCAVFGTLIADLDGVYDPSQFNDRLLLGLKGTMSEAELHVIRQRLVQGRDHKAARGELALPLPSGYVRLADGTVALDPDEEVQASVRAVFSTFERLGTVHATLRHLRRSGVRMGRRSDAGAVGGQVTWRPPRRGLLWNMLHNPTYAGAYVFGRFPCDARRRKPGHPGSGRRMVTPDEWVVRKMSRLVRQVTLGITVAPGPGPRPEWVG
jgi:DNA invertase Pin-like site-specific DNA recombinase